MYRDEILKTKSILKVIEYMQKKKVLVLIVTQKLRIIKNITISIPKVIFNKIMIYSI